MLLPALPAMTLAVVFGLLAANLRGVAAWTAGPARPGLDFAGKHLMRAGIVVLGLKVSLGDVLGLGWAALLLIVAVVLAAFAGTYGIGRLFRLPPRTSLLVATGFAICGASAIGAMAAVRRIRQEETVLPVALVTLCGTLAIGVLPLLARPLGLGPEDLRRMDRRLRARRRAGGRHGPDRRRRRPGGRRRRQTHPGDPAGPDGRRRRLPPPPSSAEADGVKRPPVIPLFVLGFVALAGLRSTGWLSPAVLDAAAVVQDVLLGMALFGLGSAVRAGQLLHTGARALLAALASWLLIAVLGLAAACLMFPRPEPFADRFPDRPGVIPRTRCRD